MGFEPTECVPGSMPDIEDTSGATWSPLFRHSCSFNSRIFLEVMMYTIRNPNVNSSWLFRADILLDEESATSDGKHITETEPRLAHFKNFTMTRILVRRLIPRNTLRDEPLDQTCLIFRDDRQDGVERNLIVYNPHVSAESEIPFYHPPVRGLAFLHEWNESQSEGLISIHYCYFENIERSPKLGRTALNLLSTLHKHGEGTNAGYVKRVHHDTIIPQVAVQTTYARLKKKHARKLLETWAEVTDPTKHVFEDLGIAAFLIELWAELYYDRTFPGFVDIGCGNGLLVWILRQEGYAGWGFDARKRKSWDQYDGLDDSEPDGLSQSDLRQHVLLPSVIDSPEEVVNAKPDGTDSTHTVDLIHDGRFPEGTFIISNHADELTPWTPILATASRCPFIMIPCCSHDLTGGKFRAPAPKQSGKSVSAYSSLVAWVSQIASDCGWGIETEMLRIPSTRNTGLIGRQRTKAYSDVDLHEILRRYGGTDGYVENVMKLVKAAPRSH